MYVIAALSGLAILITVSFNVSLSVKVFQYCSYYTSCDY